MATHRIAIPFFVAMATGVLLAGGQFGSAAGVCFAQEQDQTYHERLEYDAKTGVWKEIAAPIPGTDAGDLAVARSLLARGEYPEARKVFRAWFKTYGDSPNRVEALFYAAENEVAADDAKPKRGDVMQAYKWLEELLEGWPGTELADRAIRKEIIIAEMLLFKDRKQKIWRGMLWLSGKEEALKMLDRVIDDWARDTPVAEQALRIKADYHYLNAEFDEAETAYARLYRDFPRGRYTKVALLRSGESALARFPGAEFDSADLVEAEVYFNDFQQRYAPESGEYGIPEKLARIRESRAQKEYLVGRYYERTRATDAAVYYYRLVEQSWPETTWAVEARNRLIALGAMEPPVPEGGALPTPEAAATPVD